MKRIHLGLNANGKPVHLTEEMRRNTHLHCVGGSGTGKSKFLECLIRQDIKQGQGFCLIDWHGTLYNDLLRYCTQLDIGLLDDFRSLVLLNPSRPDFITGFNPFNTEVGGHLHASQQMDRRHGQNLGCRQH